VKHEAEGGYQQTRESGAAGSRLFGPHGRKKRKNTPNRPKRGKTTNNLTTFRAKQTQFFYRRERRVRTCACVTLVFTGAGRRNGIGSMEHQTRIISTISANSAVESEKTKPICDETNVKQVMKGYYEHSSLLVGPAVPYKSA
jgi:hypothetical protein